MVAAAFVLAVANLSRYGGTPTPCWDRGSGGPAGRSRARTMAGEAGWMTMAAAAAAVGVVVGACMADRRRRLRMAAAGLEQRARRAG
jgi:hypothetical protein